MKVGRADFWILKSLRGNRIENCCLASYANFFDLIGIGVY
jgi:hypothetical protein